jgi:outer membrane lipoprotein carrier protein
MNKVRRFVLLMSASVLSAKLAAAETTALDGYLSGLETWSADFTQTLVDAQGKSAGRERGKLLIVRPGKFRWELAPGGAGEGGQLMVADGRNVWSLDTELEQATVKPLTESLSQSPMMMLAGGVELRARFVVQATGRRDRLEWVRAQPKDAASDFREALFGFKGRELARLVVVDKLGQRSTLDFTGVKRNAPVDPSLTQFVLPKGVDLIGKPVVP